jgi:VCBS repeat-containing protein
MELVRLNLELVDLDGLSGLKVGEEFDVKFTAIDVRQNARPIVFSLYTDVTFNPAVVSAQSITYNNNPANGGFYTQAPTGTINNVAGTIEEVGAASSLLVPFVGASPTVFTVRFKVLQAGQANISTNPGEAILSEVTIYGEDGDQRGNTTFGTLPITIAAAPIANDDSATTNEDVLLIGNVLTNDTDANNDALTATVVTGPTNGSLVFNANGSFTYTPNANFNGVDSFVYQASDGALTDTATVAITVTPVNDAPIANNDSASTARNTPTTINVLSNDSDTEGNTLSVTAVGAAANGTAVRNNNGTITYTPNTGFTGSDSFSYTLSDGSATASATVTVTVANDAPIANDDSINTNEDVLLTGNVLTNDTDANNDALTTALVTGPTNGVVTLNSNGSFSYTPNANFNGTDSFVYRASDGLLTDTATVTLTVAAVNDAPVANDDSASTPRNTAATINVLSNDTDLEGNSLSVTAVGAAANGTAVRNANGTITYTPNTGFTGNDSFSYTLSDGTATDTATVTLTVTAVNDAPVANDDSVTTNEDVPLTGNVLTNDTDANNDALTTALVTGPANGIVTLNPNGSFTYTPNANFNGTDSFVYQASDGALTDTATVALTVAAVNDAPVANDDSASTVRNTATTINVLGNDTDVDSSILSVTAVGAATNGTAVLNSNGSITYTPNAGFTGNDSFSYTLSDGTITDTATVSIEVTGSQTGGYDNFIIGQPGQTEIYAGNANDFILGSLDSNSIFANGGNDLILGEVAGEIGGNDFIFAGGGDDLVLGAAGNDIILGDSGNDLIFGDQGDDVIFGGTGNDLLFGGTPNNEGAGRDLFVFGQGEGTDVVLDFEVGSDLIGLTGGLSFDKLYVVQAGDSTVIGTFEVEEVLAVLVDVQASQLTSQAFVQL